MNKATFKKYIPKVTVVIVGIATGMWIATKYLGAEPLNFQQAAQKNQLGWFGVFYGILAFCYLCFALYFAYKVILRNIRRR